MSCACPSFAHRLSPLPVPWRLVTVRPWPCSPSAEHGLLMSWGFGSGPLCLGKARLCSCAEQRLLWVLAVPGWLCSVVAAVPHLCVLSVVPGQHIRHRHGISSPRAGRMEPLPWKPRLWFPWQLAGVHTRLRLAHGGDSGHHQGQGLAGAVTLGELAWGWESWPGAGDTGLGLGELAAGPATSAGSAPSAAQVGSG